MNVLTSSSTLGDYTSPALLLPCLQVHSPAEAIRELASIIQRESGGTDFLPLYHAALNHEMLGGGPVCDGWAMPHGRVVQGTRLVFAVGKPPEPMRWFDGSPAALVFLFAVPNSMSSEYLRLISAIARVSKDPVESARLMSATTAREMWDVFARAAVRGGRTTPANA